MQAGHVDCGAVEANVPKRVTVAFPKPYTSFPAVIVCLNGLSVNLIDIGVVGVNGNSFDVIVRSTINLSNVPVFWFSNIRT